MAIGELSTCDTKDKIHERKKNLLPSKCKRKDKEWEKMPVKKHLNRDHCPK